MRISSIFGALIPLSLTLCSLASEPLVDGIRAHKRLPQLQFQASSESSHQWAKRIAKESPGSLELFRRYNYQGNAALVFSMPADSNENSKICFDLPNDLTGKINSVKATGNIFCELYEKTSCSNSLFSFGSATGEEWKALNSDQKKLNSIQCRLQSPLKPREQTPDRAQDKRAEKKASTGIQLFKKPNFKGAPAKTFQLKGNGNREAISCFELPKDLTGKINSIKIEEKIVCRMFDRKSCGGKSFSIAGNGGEQWKMLQGRQKKVKSVRCASNFF